MEAMKAQQEQKKEKKNNESKENSMRRTDKHMQLIISTKFCHHPIKMSERCVLKPSQQICHI